MAQRMTGALVLHPPPPLCSLSPAASIVDGSEAQAG
jgi:hypothetical protein